MLKFILFTAILNLILTNGKLAQKIGNCPFKQGPALCIEECFIDLDCPGFQKCVNITLI